MIKTYKLKVHKSGRTELFENGRIIRLVKCGLSSEETELARIISENIAQEIDSEILADLIKCAETGLIYT
jgi:hypothetical protein